MMHGSLATLTIPGCLNTSSKSNELHQCLSSYPFRLKPELDWEYPGAKVVTELAFAPRSAALSSSHPVNSFDIHGIC